MELISVVIPYYNDSTTIASALISLRSQRSAIGEVLIVDDYSIKSEHDALLWIVEQNPDLPINVLNLLANHGPSYARNYGIEASRYSKVFLLDADDKFVVGKLPLIINILDSYDVVFHDYSLHGLAAEGENSLFSYKTISLFDVMFGNPGAGGSSLSFNKSVVCVRFDEQMRYCEDYAFLIDVLKAGYRVVKLDGYFGSVLGRPLNAVGGLSSSRFQMRLGEALAISRIISNVFFRRLIFPLIVLYVTAKELLRLLVDGS